jgi:YVTN family beta-propeller protein
MSTRPLLNLAVLGAMLSACLAPIALADTLLVANKSDHTVDLIDIPSGRSVATLPTGQAPHEIEVSSDGLLAVISNYGNRQSPGSTLTIVNVPQAKVQRTVDLGKHTRPHGLAWIGQDRVAVTTEGSAHLLVVDVGRGEVLSEVATDQDVSHMVAVTPDGGRAFVANIGSGSVTAIDLTGGKKLTDITTGEGAEGIAVTPDGKEVWVGNRAADTLSILDPASLKIIATLPCAGFPIRVAVTPNGKRVLVSAARSGEVVVFDAGDRRELVRRKLDLSTAAHASKRLFGDTFGDSPVPVGLVVAPGGDSAWVAATQADAVVVVNTESLVVRNLLRAGREPDGMAYSPQDASGIVDPGGE